jgi:hypothetical protein
MPISLLCPCGRSLKAKDEFAGRKVRCPECRAILEVPAPVREEVEEDVLEEIEEEVMDVLPAREEPAGEKPRRGIRREPPARERPALRPAPEEDLPPRRPQPRSVERRPRDIRRKEPRVAFEEGWFGNVNAGAIGGVLMMAIAVIWFVAGLAGGIIFFYPPVLFVLGLVALIKGLASR